MTLAPVYAVRYYTDREGRSRFAPRSQAAATSDIPKLWSSKSAAEGHLRSVKAGRALNTDDTCAVVEFRLELAEEAAS